MHDMQCESQAAQLYTNWFNCEQGRTTKRPKSNRGPWNLCGLLNFCTDPIIIQARPLHRILDAACAWKNKGNHAYFHESCRKINLIKHIFTSYGLPLILSKIFSLATLARLHSIANYKFGHATWLYELQLMVIFGFVNLSQLPKPY